MLLFKHHKVYKASRRLSATAHFLYFIFRQHYPLLRHFDIYMYIESMSNFLSHIYQIREFSCYVLSFCFSTAISCYKNQTRTYGVVDTWSYDDRTLKYRFLIKITTILIAYQLLLRTTPRKRQRYSPDSVFEEKGTASLEAHSYSSAPSMDMIR